MVKKLKVSTRGARLYPNSRSGNNRVYVDHIYANESTIAYSYDYFEAGIGEGPGTWESMVDGANGLVATLRGLLVDIRGQATDVRNGSAARLDFRQETFSVVITDPPYDSMVYYSDSSDFLFVWLRRALHNTWPELAVTSDPRGLQDKTDEIIVKEHGKAPGEHRDRKHYDTRIAEAFREMRRVVHQGGLVTIVFGHGEPEVWQRLLTAVSKAGLVMTGSWPANTESGGSQGKANIETTLTMACRPAAPNRPEARKAAVEAEVRAEIRGRYPEWERFGLAPTDMLMAAAGPAMEMVGRYSQVLDHLGQPVDISTFLPIARAAVREAMAVEVDHHPLDSFDARSRFALWWVRLYGRSVAAKSELRWQALADSLDLVDVRDLVPDADKGVRFITAAAVKRLVSPDSSVIDVALAMARAYPNGLDAVGEILVSAGRESDDLYLWAAIKFLAGRLPDSDTDAIAWTAILRNRSGVGAAASRVTAGRLADEAQRVSDEAQQRLF